MRDTKENGLQPLGHKDAERQTNLVDAGRPWSHAALGRAAALRSAAAFRAAAVAPIRSSAIASIGSATGGAAAGASARLPAPSAALRYAAFLLGAAPARAAQCAAELWTTGDIGSASPRAKLCAQWTGTASAAAAPGAASAATAAGKPYGRKCAIVRTASADDRHAARRTQGRSAAFRRLAAPLQHSAGAAASARA